MPNRPQGDVALKPAYFVKIIAKLAHPSIMYISNFSYYMYARLFIHLYEPTYNEIK